jgi:hypothetical protein
MMSSITFGGACNTIAVRDCVVECTAASGCPDGFSCSAEGFCRIGGAAGSCALVLDDAGTDARNDAGNDPIDARPDAATMRRVSVIKTGAGSGTVTSTPAGIQCGVACVHDFAVGTVTLSASAAAGSTFVGWSGDCAGSGACTLAGSGDADVAARFDEVDCSGTETFEHTGAPQTLSLPSCATSLTIDARGGAGGRADFNGGAVGTGGRGGRTVATIAVASGDTFTVFVGGAGVDRTGGYNGGATGGRYMSDTSTNISTGGGGGGASDVRRNGVGSSHRIVVAGGGGGAGACTGAGWTGAAGGGLTGASAVSSCVTFTAMAGGGTQSAGGRGGGYGGTTGTPACTAASGTSGAGAAGCTQSGGGGGGAGYFGGGGGAWHGGGGGSSFAIASATSATHTQGSQTGPGQVVVTWQ